MISILVIGDAHSKISNQKNLRDCADRIENVISETKPNAIISLGDLGNDHGKVYLSALNGMVYYFDKITKAAAGVSAKTYHLLGNHECEHNQVFLEDNHILHVFKKWPNLTIVDRPIRTKSPDGFIVLCPYVPPGRFIDALDTIGREKWQESMVIFAHQEFVNADFGNNFSKVGDEWPIDHPIVVSGHIHKYGKPQPNVHYVGAPFHHTFADDTDRSISLLTFDGGVFTTEKRIDLGLPKKITVTLSIQEAKEYEIPTNAHVRVYLRCSSEDYAKFQKTKHYKELSELTKVIPEITDKVVVKSFAQRKSYLEILAEQCSNENNYVKKALEDIINEDKSQ
jgi:hypothetical protein